MHEIPQHGSTTDTFLPRLVARLHRSGFEGVIKISLGIAVRAIYLRGGEIASAASNDEQDRLQSLLIKEGRLTLPQVEMARSRQKPGVSLGKTLIEMGFLTPSELLECARRQVRQILATCFGQSEGEFHLEPGPLPPEVTILGLPTRRLIFDALMEVADRQRIVREMGSMESIYSPTGDLATGLATLQLDPTIDEVARKIDGVRSMRDLSAATSHDDFTLSKAILALEILGLVERSETPPSETTQGAADWSAKGRIIRVESAPAVATAAPPEANLADGDEEAIASMPAAAPSIPAAEENEHEADEPDEGAAEPPDFPPEDLPAFAIPPSEAAPPPQWSVDPRTGERIHEGPIEMTFDGLVRSKDRQQTVSTRLFAVSAVIVALVVLAFFLFAPGSQEEPPSMAGIAEGESPLPAGRITPPAPRERPRARRPPESDSAKRPAPATGASTAGPAPTGAGPATATPADTAQSPPHPTAMEKSPPASAAPSPEAAVATPAEDEAGAEVSAPATPDRLQEEGTPHRSLDGASSFQTSAGYAAALAQLDGGRMQSAAREFQQLVATEDPGRFTLQLMIACQAETVMRARAQSRDEGLLFVLPYRYKGQSCFRTCWGIYPGRQEATSALEHLPRAFSEAGIKPVVVALERLR